MRGNISTVDVDCPICKTSREESELVVTTSDFAYRTCPNDFHYIKCGSCDLIYLKNQPSADSMDRIYPRNYTAYSSNSGLLSMIRRWSFRYKFFSARRLLPRDMRNRPLKVLDYGCGNGEMVDAIATLSQRTVAASVGFDGATSINEIATQGARSGIFTDSLRDAKQHGPFDLIFLTQVIEHLPDPATALSEIRSCMSSKGVLSIETPSPTGPELKLRHLKYWGGWHAPRHFVIFEANYLAKLLVEVGFMITQIASIPSPYMWSQTLSAGSTNRHVKRFVSIKCIPFLVFITSIDFFFILSRLKTSNMRIRAVNS